MHALFYTTVAVAFGKRNVQCYIIATPSID